MTVHITNENLITLAEAAKLLPGRPSIEKVKRLIRRGQLRGGQPYGENTHWLVEADSVAEIANNTQYTPATPRQERRAAIGQQTASHDKAVQRLKAQGLIE